MNDNQRADDYQISGDHYQKLGVQPWAAMEAWMPREQFIGFLRGNAIKYLARAGHKDDLVEAAKKAKHYLEKLIEVTENDQPQLDLPPMPFREDPTSADLNRSMMAVERIS